MKSVISNYIFKLLLLIAFVFVALQSLSLAQKALKANAISKCTQISQFKKIDKAATPNITYEVSYPEKDTYNQCLERVEDTFK